MQIDMLQEGASHITSRSAYSVQKTVLQEIVSPASSAAERPSATMSDNRAANGAPYIVSCYCALSTHSRVSPARRSAVSQAETADLVKRPAGFNGSLDSGSLVRYGGLAPRRQGYRSSSHTRECRNWKVVEAIWGGVREVDREH